MCVLGGGGEAKVVNNGFESDYRTNFYDPQSKYQSLTVSLLKVKTIVFRIHDIVLRRNTFHMYYTVINTLNIILFRTIIVFVHN